MPYRGSPGHTLRSEIVRTSREEARDVKASLQVLRYVRKKNPRICRRKREEGGDGVGKVDVYTRSTLVFGGEVFRGFTPHAFRALPKGPDRVGTQEAVRAGRSEERRVGREWE